MADRKRTRSRKKRTSRYNRFSEVKGKTVEAVEIDADVIGIFFQDKTALTFDVDSVHIIYPELSDWRTGNMRSIKKWPAVRSKPSMIEWP